ncbi:30S ribosomal protein S18 [Candidatus Atribacteria bacterium 4572_76]|nr:MAG: 30S ribosomal protein S18 [Candidatus Atribacteria bacterium 4572_76]
MVLLEDHKGKFVFFAKKATGNCARHQRTLAISIKRAREIGLLPYVAK